MISGGLRRFGSSDAWLSQREGSQRVKVKIMSWSGGACPAVRGGFLFPGRRGQKGPANGETLFFLSGRESFSFSGQRV